MADIAWVDHTVSTKDNPTQGTWSDVANLACRQLRTGVNRVDSATLIYEYGTIDGSYVAPLDIVGKFVRIVVSSPAIDWVGYVIGERKARWHEETIAGPAQRVKGGDQLFTVVGLEWFLGRKDDIQRPRQKRAGERLLSIAALASIPAPGMGGPSNTKTDRTRARPATTSNSTNRTGKFGT